jgi:hydrogenase-4 component B
MSGVMLKAGIYGILRMTSLVTHPPLWWSIALGLLGAATAVTGIALAFAQADIKRALAYSSVENVGIVCLGIAFALAGRTIHEPLYIALGIGGAIAHVWSHGAFKSLLFFASGGVIHEAHSRSMEQMGGLLRRMPVTGTTFLIGAMAASGLPLMNAFISEWLIAMGFFHAIRANAPPGWFLAIAAPALALAGALALASFFRIVSVAFLGEPRTTAAKEAQDSSWPMLAPLVFLSAVCVTLGIFPQILATPLQTVGSSWSHQTLAPLSTLLSMPVLAFAPLILLLTICGGLLAFLVGRSIPRRQTWDCGYALPTARMQYTAGSTGEWFSQRLLPPALRPLTTGKISLTRENPALPPSRAEVPSLQSTELFPSVADFQTGAADPFAARFYEPFAAKWSNRFERLRWLQQGRLTVYLIYILIVTLGGVAWAALRGYLR